MRKALVLGRNGIVRSLGREGIPVTLVREGTLVFERASRYCREFIRLPNLVYEREKAVEVLEEYGSRQDEKPVAFFNGESDVLLFSEYRRRLEKYYTIMLSPHDLIVSLIDKAEFNKLAEKHSLPIPKTVTPRNNEECICAADDLGYPCVLKPVSQRRWHSPEIIEAIGLHKALLIKSRDELERILALLPPVDGGEMIQQYIPGDDPHHYDFHSYIDKDGIPRGWVVGHKIRTYPIHFGQGCYTHYVDEPRIRNICLESLANIKYVGAANINVKRHSITGKDYILEINPRYSLWVIFDSLCGVNLPLLHYNDALDFELPKLRPHGLPRRWLLFARDRKAMMDYWNHGEITPWQWFKSFFTYKGKIEFHVFAWDDPAPLLAYWWFGIRGFANRILKYIIRRLYG